MKHIVKLSDRTVVRRAIPPRLKRVGLLAGRDREVVALLEDALELLSRCYARWDEYDQDDSPDLGNGMEDFLVLTGIIDKGRWNHDES